jgi:hypothetical protein
MGRRSGHIGEILIVFFVGVSTALCFDLTVLHTNDVHGRFEETDKHGFSCVSNDACFGGVARIASVVKEVRNKEENVVLVDGGDRFTGTLWSAVYKGNASRVFFNELNYTAIVSGFSEGMFKRNHRLGQTPSNILDTTCCSRSNTVLKDVGISLNLSNNTCIVDATMLHLSNGFSYFSLCIDFGQS